MSPGKLHIGWSAANAILVAAILCLQVGVSVSVKPISAKADSVKKRNKTEAFLDWLRQNDVTEVFPPGQKLSIYYPGTGEYERGLIAAANIPSGAAMASIPFSIALELREDDPLPFEEADWRPTLAAKLLRELAKGEASRWKPYLDLFPRHHPIPWLDLHMDEFEEVQYEPTIRRIADLQHEVIQEWKISDPTVIANATLEEFGWALNMVWTHALSFVVPKREGGSREGKWRHMFLPVADLLGHDVEANTEWEKKGVFPDRLELLSVRYIPKGQPALADAGGVTTEAMFLLYGVVTPRNPRDSTVLFYHLEEAVEWFLRRFHKDFHPSKKKEIHPADLAQYLGPAKDGAVKELRDIGRAAAPHHFEPQYADPHDNTHGDALMLYPKGAVDPRLLGAFAQLQREVQREVQGHPWEADDDEWPIDVEDSFRILHLRCTELLRAFNTTLHEDEEILRKAESQRRSECDKESGECHVVGGLSPSIELAVRFRMVKKMALEELIKAHPPYQGPILHDEL